MNSCQRAAARREELQFDAEQVVEQCADLGVHDLAANSTSW